MTTNAKSGMSHRERFMAVMNGETPDRIPVCTSLDFWYRARQVLQDGPPEIAGRSHDEVCLDLDIGLFKFCRLWEAHFRPPVHFKKWRDGTDAIEEWQAPSGTLRRVRRHNNTEHDAFGMQANIEEYPIRSLNDYRVFIEIMQHLEFKPDPDFQRFHETDTRLGPNGVPGTCLSKAPVHDMMMKWVGYENAYYHLADDPDLVEEAMAATTQAHRPQWDIVASSPAEIIMFDGNYTSAMTPPPTFERFFLPALKEFNHLMHQAGKKVISHTDGDMTGLLELFMDAGFDGTNCHACAPLVPCTLAEAVRVWGDRIAIWGGMPSILLEAAAHEKTFQSHLEEILRCAKSGARLIVGISDHAMPAARYERIAAMARFFVENGAL